MNKTGENPHYVFRMVHIRPSIAESLSCLTQNQCSPSFLVTTLYENFKQGVVGSLPPAPPVTPADIIAWVPKGPGFVLSPGNVQENLQDPVKSSLRIKPSCSDVMTSSSSQGLGLHLLMRIRFSIEAYISGTPRTLAL